MVGKTLKCSVWFPLCKIYLLILIISICTFHLGNKKGKCELCWLFGVEKLEPFLLFLFHSLMRLSLCSSLFGGAFHVWKLFMALAVLISWNFNMYSTATANILAIYYMHNINSAFVCLFVYKYRQYQLYIITHCRDSEGMLQMTILRLHIRNQWINYLRGASVYINYVYHVDVCLYW